MKTPNLPKVLFILVLAAFFSTHLLAQNRTLSFDGVDDYVVISPTPIPPGFSTVEAWFYSTSTTNPTTCTGDGEVLFWHGSSLTDYILLGECNGDLFIQVEDGSSNSYVQVITPSVNILNAWHHISLITTKVMGIPSIVVFVDCNLVFSQAITTANSPNKLIIGKHGDPTKVDSEYKGLIDEVRVWSIDRSWPLCTYKNCLVSNNEPNLVAYYKMDQGTAGGNNTAITQIDDLTGNGHQGVLNNFTLTGNSSNFITSSAPITYPDLTIATLNILNYPTRTTPITEILSGEPVHFCLEVNGVPIAQNPNITVAWQYRSDLGSWINLPPAVFNGYCFAVPPGELSINCSNNIKGYELWEFRAMFNVKNSSGQNTCLYYSIPKLLKICCPLDQTQVTASTNHTGDLLCDTDPVTYQVNLTSAYPFINNVSLGTSINWAFNGQSIPFTNQTSFTYSAAADVNQGACFEATVGISCNQTAKFQKCFNIDPIPICGTITDNQSPNNLTLVAIDEYTICPGNDASLKVATPFTNCIMTWQYSFSPTGPWNDLGATNSIQNTNILPTSLWPGNEIFYRIKGAPLSTPSGCDPCYSNVIKISIRPNLVPGSIAGPAHFCFGSSVVIKHIGHDPTLSNQWYHNGIPVGTGATLTITDGGCYWVESTDGCYVTSTAKYCVDACKVIPVISCPDVCPRPDVPITLSACGSSDSCGQPLTYSWTVSGSNAPTINGCTITHVPDAGSNTYSVKVTNAYGCSATTSRTITPCLN